MILAVNQHFFPKGPKIASDKSALTFLTHQMTIPLLSTAECMINYIMLLLLNSQNGLCHQAVQLGTSQGAVMLCGCEGNFWPSRT